MLRVNSKRDVHLPLWHARLSILFSRWGGQIWPFVPYLSTSEALRSRCDG